MPAVLWFRRDLRLRDNPALLTAAPGSPVVPLFVLDPRLWDAAGPVRRAWLAASLAALDASVRGRGGRGLLVLRGDPAAVVPAAAAAAGAAEVHVAADHGPYGAARDAAVDRALRADGRALVATGSPYAVAPGRLRTAAGAPYKVFTPFFRAWLDHGWRAPAPDPDPWPALTWRSDAGLPVAGLPVAEPPGGTVLPGAGEDAAARRWADFRAGALPGYAAGRDRADLPGTSALGVHLRWGEVHPRTLLADLAAAPGAGPDAFRRELAWREFCADLLARRPDTVRRNLDPRFDRMDLDDDPGRLEAWCAGRTGFPLVDAGMRQLRGEGWMHNRVRMVAASFLVKDLHLPWWTGAAEFMRWLRDGDVASNTHNWQWVAGSGADAAPYFRVFNPVAQGLRHDPAGDYVRRWVPELRHLGGAAAHEPWKAPGGYDHGYPARIVDHAEERREALRRFEALRG